MQERFFGEASKTTMVCIDSYEQGVLAGRFYNLGQENGGCAFHSLTQFLIRMEHMLNTMNCPQQYTAIRSFAAAQEPRIERLPGSGFDKGRLATFMLKVLVRQHTSWQGTVTWVDRREKQSFRSVLELILLIDSALGSDQNMMSRPTYEESSPLLSCAT